MKKPLLWIVVAFSMLMSSSTPSVYQNPLLQREIAMLNERGVTYRMLASNQLEVTDPQSGQRWMFDADRLLTLRKPTYDTIPTLTVDLRTIDTNLYNWRFHYVNSLPISGEWGFPLQVGDLNHNGRPESYGPYQTQAIYIPRIYEQDAIGAWVFRYQYPENTGLVDKQGDLDRNGLSEVYLRYGDSLFVFEQPAPDSLPTNGKFCHRQWHYSATGIPNQVAYMTGGTLPEVIYRGSEPDSITTNKEKTYVVRYDSTLNNLRRIWSIQLPLGCEASGCTGAIATGDFDGDGKKEFATSNFSGNVFVVEHVSGDSFAVTWSTNLSVAGRAASGDVDGNGITEFFIGGTQAEPDGYVHLRAYAYERTGDNSFQPVFAFNIFPAGIFFVDLYQTADVDGDNIPELLLSFAGGVMIIKGVGEHNYQVFYYQPPYALDGVAAWKINGSRSANLFVSRHLGGQPIVKRTDMYKLDSTLVASSPRADREPSSVRLYQNYPNPFNPQTVFAYELPERGRVKLVVYDITGKVVITLVDEVQGAGTHTTYWNPSEKGGSIGMSAKGGHASGVYVVRLTANNQAFVRKILYLK